MFDSLKTEYLAVSYLLSILPADGTKLIVGMLLRWRGGIKIKCFSGESRIFYLWIGC